MQMEARGKRLPVTQLIKELILSTKVSAGEHPAGQKRVKWIQRENRIISRVGFKGPLFIQRQKKISL